MTCLGLATLICMRQYSAADQQLTITPRFLFTMGSLCLYGADILDKEVQVSRTAQLP